MLKNKNILIVGAGGLLGASVVAAALKLGAKVRAADANYEGMKKRLIDYGVDIVDPGLNLLQFNTNNEHEVISFFENTEKLDGAVNCTYPRNKTYGKHFFDVQLADFNENLSLHLGSFFLFSQQCAAYFVRNNHPFALVNISSVYGVITPKFDIYRDTPMTMPVEYSAIKAALLHLNKYIVSYIGKSDFRINSVSPGGIFDKQPENFLKEYKKHTLGKGMLNIEDVTGTILFLISDHSQYINGQNIIVDDGFSL